MSKCYWVAAMSVGIPLSNIESNLYAKTSNFECINDNYVEKDVRLNT